MSPADIDRVFGRGRLRMVTGDHVEVFREESLPGERRRYTKRFLATSAGDFRHWTEREWRILARLVGHGIGPVPDVVQFDRGAVNRPALVQTYDAGITVDHWATLLPVQRDGTLLRHVFEDCAHWWALARHSLIALDAIHELRLVHLDLKADNVCIPFGPTDFDPYAPGAALSPRFDQIALIDFAFSLVSGEALTSALPIARQADYEYQSPRLLQALEAGARGDLMPTRQLDWRCDVYSLAAMLRRYLPDPEAPLTGAWTPPRLAQARALVRRLLEAHDADSPIERPHAELIALTGHALAEPDLAESLQRGWALAVQAQVARDDTATPVTRIAMPVSTDLLRQAPVIDDRIYGEARPLEKPGRPARRGLRAKPWALGAVSAAMGASVLAAGWWVVRDQQAEQRHVIATTPVPKVPRPAIARAPAPPPAVVAQAPAPTIEPRPEPAPAPEPKPDTVPAPATEPAREAVREAAPAAAPAPTAAMARAAEPKVEVAPPPKPAATPRTNAVARSNATRRSPAPTAAQAAASRRAAANAAAAHAPARTAATASERERVLAWLTARGPSPRAGMSFGAPAPAVPAQAAAPAPAPTPAPMAAAAAAPIPAPALLPATVQPAVATVQEPATPPVPPDFAARASTLLSTGWLTRAARRAEPLVSQAMAVAAQPDGAADREDDIREAVSRLGGLMTDATNIGFAPDSFEARRLNDAAAQAYWRRGNVPDALDLQLKAFGANPLDATVAGQLAFLQLRVRPAQADIARQLALHALTLRDAKLQAARPEDWTTLAIANALLGRDRDARNAWFVALALAPNPETQCRAAISAYNKYGEALRPPVEAVLYRAYLSGRASRSPFCAWPPYWAGVAGGTGR